MGRRRQTGGRSSGERPPRDGLGGHRPRLRAAAKPPAVWAGVDRPQPAPYLAPTLEQEMLTLAEARRGDGAGVIFGYAGRDETGPFVVAVRVVPFAQVEPLEGGVRVPRPSWWALHQAWQAEFPDLEPVGWFRIQPGRGTALGSYDRFTAYQRFADPLQFTWVLDPQRGRQAFYVWEGSDLVPLPGYWRCTQPPQVPAPAGGQDPPPDARLPPGRGAEPPGPAEALGAGGCGREIRISTANESPGELTIIVQDHGIGIEPEAMNRIFNPFEQGERSLKRRFGGLGLGLAISKSLAEAHAATLTAMSEGLNRGATFRLTIKTSALIAHDGTISLPVQARVRWVLRILLVDDHIDTCTVMGKLLAARGHRVTVAHDMKSALERIEAGGFDVVISDVGLPDGSGTELISKSKNRLVGIAMSGFGTDADARRSLEAGFSQHLIKPVTMEKLDAALQAAMNGPAGDGWESALRR